jgi:hypothetical protein
MGIFKIVFECTIVLRQGFSLSPIVFALFINEMYNYSNVGKRYQDIQRFPDIVK